MGRPRKFKKTKRIEIPKCPRCGSRLRYIGRELLDESRAVDIKILGGVKWGGQKFHDIFFCDTCKQTYARKAKKY